VTTAGNDRPLGPALATERLRLRRWRDADREPFAAMNADPLVMATLGPLLSRDQSDALLDRIEAHFEERGFGLWCVDAVGVPGRCIGFVGLSVPRFEAPFLPAVEIGWRIASAFWGLGYAPEAARAVLAFAWDALGLDEVVSFTAAINSKSRRVMDKVGLVRDPDGDFEHPDVPAGDPLRPHVLYRGRRP
jgi:RimJ/RimL family protein N-acetyltransferase